MRQNAIFEAALAAAYAEVDLFDKAMSLELEAISRAKAGPAERKAQVQECEAHLELYRRHEPWRE